MPLTKTDTTNEIRRAIIPNDSQKDDCKDVIAKLAFDDLLRGAGTLHEEGEARLDMQGQITAGGVNLQVQIGGKTAAAAIIADSVREIADEANQRGAGRAACSVLRQSLDSRTVWTLTGTLP